MASTRNDMRTMRSIGEKTRTTPGPLGVASTRPSRKTTPRSYSARILMLESRYRIDHDQRDKRRQIHGHTPVWIYYAIPQVSTGQIYARAVMVRADSAPSL